MTELINPRSFKVTVHKVRPMYLPKFYLAAVQIKDRVRLLRDNTRYKTRSAAAEHGNKVMERWCRLYDAAVLELSMPEPTANINPSPAEA